MVIDRVELLDGEKGFTFARWRDLFIVVWRVGPTVSSVNRLSSAFGRAHAGYPRGVTTLVIIEQGSAMPDTPARELMVRDMKRLGGAQRVMGVVFEGSGFLASTVRSVLIGMLVLSRQSVSTKIFATVSEATGWLSGCGLAEPATKSELLAVIADARRGGSPPG